VTRLLNRKGFHEKFFSLWSIKRGGNCNHRSCNNGALLAVTINLHLQRTQQQSFALGDVSHTHKCISQLIDDLNTLVTFGAKFPFENRKALL